MKILDAGCGSRRYKGNEGDEVIGLDFINNKYADKKHNLNKYPYPFKDNEFDMIYCCHVLEHLDNPIRTMEEFWRITKPSGRIIIKVPHYSSSGASNNIEHKHYFASASMSPFESHATDKIHKFVRFKVKSKIRWLHTFQYAKHRVVANLEAIITTPVEWFINQNFYTKLLAERFLCYHLCGFDEVEFDMEVVKG